MPNGSFSAYQQRRGYVFEVPAPADQPIYAMPVFDKGRFNHEATATAPRTGIVYQTEDTGDSLFYRYLPHHRGKLLLGGTLQALRLKDFQSGVNTRPGFHPPDEPGPGRGVGRYCQSGPCRQCAG